MGRIWFQVFSWHIPMKMTAGISMARVIISRVEKWASSSV